MTHIVTLTTDFGTADGYVGEMKAELLTHAPGATLVDITHDIPRHDVDSARLTVARFWRRFPAGTVHLVVVDPGVGSSRAALAVASDDRYLVGPDNGALSPALSRSDALVVELRIPGDASATFHGRDVFAPIAAALARGEPITTLGSPPRETPIICSTPEPVRGPGGGLRSAAMGATFTETGVGPDREPDWARFASEKSWRKRANSDGRTEGSWRCAGRMGFSSVGGMGGLNSAGGPLPNAPTVNETSQEARTVRASCRAPASLTTAPWPRTSRRNPAGTYAVVTPRSSISRWSANGS